MLRLCSKSASTNLATRCSVSSTEVVFEAISAVDHGTLAGMERDSGRQG